MAAKRAPQRTAVLLRIPNFFENLALIIKAGNLDIALVSLDYKTVANETLKKWRPAIAELRQSDPYSYSQLEWLVKEMEKQPDA